MVVVGGSTSVLEGGIVYPVVIAMPHPAYNISDSIINDIGLLKVFKVIIKNINKSCSTDPLKKLTFKHVKRVMMYIFY